MSIEIMRQIVLDNETTGMNKFGIHYEGHRIIEIGAVEIIDRRLTGRNFHVYLQPDRLVDPEAFKIHGISDEFLKDKPKFSDIADEFLHFIYGGELIIHNAPFDIGFINYEFEMLNRGISKINTFCKVLDSLLLARKIFPGKRNSLDALCERYLIDKNERTHHSALLDAKILADIFLLMTGGQTEIHFTVGGKERRDLDEVIQIHKVKRIQRSLKVIYANDDEIASHEQFLDIVQRKSGVCIWRMKRPTRNK